MSSRPPFHTISRKRKRKMIRQAIGKNWRDVMAYERFQFKMWHACGCDLFCRPCDGVLAGGICDSATRLSRLQPEDLDEDEASHTGQAPA